MPVVCPVNPPRRRSLEKNTTPRMHHLRRLARSPEIAAMPNMRNDNGFMDGPHPNQMPVLFNGSLLKPASVSTGCILMPRSEGLADPFVSFVLLSLGEGSGLWPAQGPDGDPTACPFHQVRLILVTTGLSGSSACWNGQMVGTPSNP